jgi:hypothetical protein
MADDEYHAIARAAHRRGTSVAKLVRDSLRERLIEEDDADPERKAAAILRFARFAGPTGDIDQILEEIERGRQPA